MRKNKLITTTAALASMPPSQGAKPARLPARVPAPAPKQKLSAQGVESNAMEMANLVVGEAGEKFEQAIETALVAREEVAQGAVYVRENLITLFADKLNDFPFPDSGPAKPDDTSNTLFDKYETQVRNAKGNAWIMQTGSWYKNFARDIPLGRAYVAIMVGAQEWVKDGTGPATYQLPTPDGMQEEAYPVDIVEAAQLVETYDARLTAINEMIKKAVLLHLQFKRIETDMPLVKAHYAISKATGAIVPTLKPIIVRNADMVNASGEARQFTVNSFIGFDIDKALAKGGKWTDLTATAKGEGDSDQTTVAKLVNDDPTFYSAMSDMVYFLENVANMGRIRKQLNQPGDESLIKVITIADLYELLTPIYNEHSEAIEANRKLQEKNKKTGTN